MGLGPGEELAVTADAAEASADFEFLSISLRLFDDEFEGRSVIVDVTDRGTREIVTRGLYQLRRDALPPDSFEGGHGFTGLLYSYHPSGAELQHICAAELAEAP